MKEITNIRPIELDLKSRPTQKELDSSEDIKRSFETELLQTVKKLETVENEIDAMIENHVAQSSTGISSGVNSVGNYINSIAGIVEDLSPEHPNPTGVKSSKFVTEQYSKSVSKKEP